jgi:hypothetical protein
MLSMGSIAAELDGDAAALALAAADAVAGAWEAGADDAGADDVGADGDGADEPHATIMRTTRGARAARAVVRIDCLPRHTAPRHLSPVASWLSRPDMRRQYASLQSAEHRHRTGSALGC